MSKVALALALVALVACHRRSPGKDDAPIGGGSDAPIDAAVLPSCTNPIHGTHMTMRKIGNVGGSAILSTSPPLDTRLFVIRQDGLIYIFENELMRATPFIDLTSKIVAGGEQGMLGLAFHPQYRSNGKFYVDYTANNPDTADTMHPWVDVVEEYTVTMDPSVADPTSGRILVSIPDPYTNHNGGMIEFGSDGYLYISTGDGGAGGDPVRNSQNPNALLGKMLRIDVDNPSGGKPYGIPSDNPFVAGGGAPEVFMLGLRNPWRWSFDRGTGDMWIGDVGQNAWEELDVIRAGQQSGKNLGWSMWEGNACYGNYPCTMPGMTFPQLVWEHGPTPWVAIIGGQVYRGTCYPDLVGTYFFTDYGAHTLSTGVLNADNSVTYADLAPPTPPPVTGGWPQAPSSLHADSRGELYETTTGGDVWHLEAGP
jgi:glucose/arabinose dehydrogenase